MKKENTLELINHLKERKPFKVNYDGEDYGIYKYNLDKDRYEGVIGHISINKMFQAIKDQEYFIKLEKAN